MECFSCRWFSLFARVHRPGHSRALGLSSSSPLAPREQLLNHLRPKSLLLVLDNLEHLLEGIGLLAEVLEQAPGVKLLVTSRERLNMQGEWLFDIQGLPVPPLDQVDRAEEYSAVALFVQSARRIHSNFVLSGGERRILAASATCWRCAPGHRVGRGLDPHALV